MRTFVLMLLAAIAGAGFMRAAPPLLALTDLDVTAPARGPGNPLPNDPALALEALSARELGAARDPYDVPEPEPRESHE